MASLYQHLRAFVYRCLPGNYSPLMFPDTKYSFPRPPPPPPLELLAHRRHYNKWVTRRKYLAPPGEDDCPLYSLYRLYETVVLDRTIAMRNELEYFWNQHEWPVSEIPDPKDDDEPARYAVLACITQMMVTAFNNNVRIGLPRDAPAIMTDDQAEEFRNRTEEEKIWERAPGWAARVPSLKETLKIPHRVDLNDERKGFAVLPDMNDPGASEMYGEKISWSGSLITFLPRPRPTDKTIVFLEEQVNRLTAFKFSQTNTLDVPKQTLGASWQVNEQLQPTSIQHVQNLKLHMYIPIYVGRYSS